MKKIYALILAIVMVISLFGCANGNDPVGETDNTVTTEATLGDHKHDHGNETIGATEGTENTTKATEDTKTPSETETIPDSPDDIGNGGVEDKPSENTPKPTQPAPTKPAENKHEHSYTSKVTSPTCESKGYTTYTCSCGDSYKSNYKDATGHNYKTETVAPTTEAKGYDIHTCSKCGKSYKDNYTDKLPAPTEPAPTEPAPTEPAPTEPAPTEPAPTEPAPTEHKHSYTSKVTSPTCESKGYTTYTCSCGDSYKSDYKDATGHNYKTETVAPTTDAEGYDIHTCSKCGKSYKDNYTDKLPAPTEPAPTEPAECTNHEASADVLASVTVSNTWYNASCNCDYSTLYTADTREGAIALVHAHIAEHGGKSETHYVSAVIGIEQYDHPTFFDCIHCGETCVYSDYYEWREYISKEYFDYATAP